MLKVSIVLFVKLGLKVQALRASDSISYYYYSYSFFFYSLSYIPLWYKKTQGSIVLFEALVSSSMEIFLWLASGFGLNVTFLEALLFFLAESSSNAFLFRWLAEVSLE